MHFREAFSLVHFIIYVKSFYMHDENYLVFQTLQEYRLSNLQFLIFRIFFFGWGQFFWDYPKKVKMP